MDCIDLSRKRVWLGVSLPGKRMIELARTANLRPLFRSDRLLFESYQGPPWKGLLCAAIALRCLPDEPAADRAAVLADTRDFLALRYRANGLEEPSGAELLEDLKDRYVPDDVVPERPDLLINYLVTALDALSNDADACNDDEVFTLAADILAD